MAQLTDNHQATRLSTLRKWEVISELIGAQGGELMRIPNQ